MALERGEPRWSTAVPAPFEPGVVPGFDDDGVAVVDVLGNVSLLDAASGRLHWTTATSFAPVLESTVLVTGSAVAFRQGDLRRHVLASAAIPGVFPPVAVDGRTFIDGGVSSHVPLLPARDLGAKTMVVLDTGFP